MYLDRNKVMGSTTRKYDLVRDGAITVADFLIFVDNYGKTVPPDSSGGTNSPYTAGEQFRDCPECPLMVVVPPGSFTMGESASKVDSYGLNFLR